MGVKTTTLAGPTHRFCVISAGETGKSCREPCLLGDCSQWALLALLAWMGRCPQLTMFPGCCETLVGRYHHPTSPGFCFRLYLLGYHSQWNLLALLACVGRCPRPTLILLARMARMLQVAHWPNLDIVPVCLRVGDPGGSWWDVSLVRPY